MCVCVCVCVCVRRKLQSADRESKIQLASCNNQCPKEVYTHTLQTHTHTHPTDTHTHTPYRHTPYRHTLQTHAHTHTLQTHTLQTLTTDACTHTHPTDTHPTHTHTHTHTRRGLNRKKRCGIKKEDKKTYSKNMFSARLWNPNEICFCFPQQTGIHTYILMADVQPWQNTVQITVLWRELR